MAQITYDDKVSVIVNPLPDINKVTDDDMNEIKDVVNENALTLTVIAWDFTTDTVPTTGKNGQRYHGTGATTLTTGSGAVIPLECMFTQIVNSPANNTDTSAFVFTQVIF